MSDSESNSSENNVFHLPQPEEGRFRGPRGGGGGNDGSGIHIDLITPYIDAKMGEARASIVSELEKSIMPMKGRLDLLPTTWTLISVAGATLLGGLAIVAYAGERFDGGMAASAAFSQEIAAQKARDDKQTALIQEINEKIDAQKND